MKEELETLLKNETWEVVDVPKDIKLITCKWVYKVKRKSDGSVNKFKAILVVRGFLQVYGLDYHNFFAPIAKVVTMRLLLNCAVHQHRYVH